MKKRGICSDKKATGDIESYFILIKIIVAIGAISAMTSYVYSVTTDTFFDKFYFSRDIAFMANAAYSSPNNLYIEYQRDKLSKFIIDFSNNKVNLFERDSELPFGYFYAKDLDYRFESGKITNNNKIVFQKTPYLFQISDKLEPRLKLLKCKNIISTDPDWENKRLLIDSGHGNDDGFTNGNLKENVIVGSIGFSLNNKFLNSDTTRENIGRSIEEQTRKDAAQVNELVETSNTIISIHMGNYSSENNNIKIFVSAIGEEDLVIKREKLGCLIINNIFSENELKDIFTGGNIISVNPEHVEGDYQQILNNEKISIVIEIGNIQSDKSMKLQKTEIIFQIAGKIHQGVKDYYE
ncbi:MAG: hypothetical protein U9O94_03760 [Nanoarchaeota archaeon]|nr:hypothetical protein [Nanoarchaeota archaeon]